MIDTFILLCIHFCPCLFILTFIHRGCHFETNSKFKQQQKVMKDVAFRIFFSSTSAFVTDNLSHFVAFSRGLKIKDLKCALH